MSVVRSMVPSAFVIGIILVRISALFSIASGVESATGLAGVVSIDLAAGAEHVDHREAIAIAFAERIKFADNLKYEVDLGLDFMTHSNGMNLSLVIDWVLLNEPVSPEVFDYRNIEVQEHTLVEDLRVSPSRIVDELYPGRLIHKSEEEPNRGFLWIWLNLLAIVLFASLMLYRRHFRFKKNPAAD